MKIKNTKIPKELLCNLSVMFIFALLLLKEVQYKCRRGGIGRHARLRI